MARKRRDRILVQVPHPLRWLIIFCRALLYGPSYSAYDEMSVRFGVTPGEKLRLMKEAEGQVEAPGAAEAPGMNQHSGKAKSSIGVGIPLMGYGPGGYSDKDDESYYGL